MVKKMTIEEAIEKAEEIALEKAREEIEKIIKDRLEEIGEVENDYLKKLLEENIEINKQDPESFANIESFYKGFILCRDSFTKEIEKGTELGKKLDKFFEEDYYSASEYAYRIVGIGQIFECNYKNHKFHSAKHYDFDFEVELTEEEDKCTEENCLEESEEE